MTDDKDRLITQLIQQVKHLKTEKGNLRKMVEMLQARVNEIEAENKLLRDKIIDLEYEY